MKNFTLYDINYINNVDDALNILLDSFDSLESVASTTDYASETDRKTYREYVKSLKRYFEKCEKLLLDEVV